MKSNKTRIVFRADGNHTMGLGHVVRLLSLVEMCRVQYDCLFIIKEPSSQVAALIRQYCSIKIISTDTELNTILQPVDIVVLDGYHFDSAYQQHLKSLAGKLVVIDDKAEIHFYADLVINHGGEYIKGKYSREPYTKLLTGFQYLLLRPEFLSAAQKNRIVEKIDTVYICMGGADPFNITIKAMQACAESSFVKKIIVITGSAYANKAALLEAIGAVKRQKQVVHEESISAERMVQLIGESDLAICSASAVAIEVCCVKAGLLVGTVVDNQEAIHQQLLQTGCCISLGDFNKATAQDISQHLQQLADTAVVNAMVQKQWQAIDGHSARRILSEIKTMAA